MVVLAAIAAAAAAFVVLLALVVALIAGVALRKGPPVTVGRAVSPGALALVRLEPRAGLRVARRNRWVRPEVAERIAAAAESAAAAGHALVVGEASREGGGPFPPHLSHQTGEDVDVAYDDAGYPSPARTVPPAWWLTAIAAAEPTAVFTSAELLPLLRAAGLPARQWPGHTRHAHLRFS